MAKPFSHAIVVGASSGIGAEIARELAARGCRVELVARRAAELDAVAASINAAAPERASTYVHDVTRYDDVPGMFEQIRRDLGGLDLVVYAVGVMPPIGEREYAFAKDHAILAVNVLGAIAWLNAAAAWFESAGAGTIVGISSIAGERGRRGNPVYAASKAALTTYLEALRNRLARRGVAVVTVKPGPVATPMTVGLSRLPFVIPVDRAAREILAAAERGVPTAYVPRVWRPLMVLIRSLPSALMRRLDI